MRKKLILITILSLLLLIQPNLSTNFSIAETYSNQVDRVFEISLDRTIKQDIGLGGEEQIKTNFNPNPGFEYTDNQQGPGDTSYYGSAFQFSDAAHGVIPHSGSYCGKMSAQGNIQQYANAYLSRYLGSIPRPYADDIEFDFWYYLLSNPDISNYGQIYIQLNFWTPTGGTYIYYYLSSSFVPSNTSSTTTNYDLTASSPFGIWNNINRDITTDFSARFGAPDPTSYLSAMYFYSQSPNDATGLTSWLIDDISVTNSTAYEWLADNGDFESGTGSSWGSYNRGTGLVLLTDDDHIEGSKAANMTTYIEQIGTYADCSISTNLGHGSDPPGGVYANQPGDVVISFNWKYNDYNPGTSHFAYFTLSASNESHEMYFYWYLGDESDIRSDSNSTTNDYSYFYTTAPGFGSRGIWNEFYLDAYELLSEVNMTNMPITYAGFRIYGGSTYKAKTQLLLDNYNVIADPLGDPGFEEDWYYTPTNPIPSWRTNFYDENYVSFSPNSHSGDNAANISSHSSPSQVRIYRDTFIPVGDNLYSDIWWYMDELHINSYSYAQIYFELDYEFYLNYVFAAGDSFTTSNSSSSYYYFADNYNVLDTWNLFERDIAKDALTSFGEGNYNITEVRIYVYGSGTELNTLLIDDVHFVRDTHGPQLISQNLLNTPTYYQNAIIEIFAQDYFTRVSYVEVFFRTNSAWDSVIATPSGMYFLATIPAQEWGIPVEYYFVMRDTFGLETIENNEGAYYSYDIIDDIDPIVSILNVTTDEDYGLSEINIQSVDIGSGIEFIEIFDGGTEPIAILTSEPYTYIWDSNIVQESGLHNIRILAHDYAGNIGEATFNINVGIYEAPGPFVSFFQSWGTLVGAGIVGISWGVVAIVQTVKKPKT